MSGQTEIRVLAVEEIDAVSGASKKAVARYTQKCTVSKAHDGTEVQTCKTVKFESLR